MGLYIFPIPSNTVHTDRNSNISKKLSIRSKGTVPQGFFRECFPGPLSLIFFWKIHEIIRSSRCTTGIKDICGKWKKSSIRGVINFLFRHMGNRVHMWIHFFLILTLRCKQSDIVAIICHWNSWHRWQIFWWLGDLPLASTTPVANFPPISTTAVVNANHRKDVANGGQLPPVTMTPTANLPRVSLTPVVHLDLQISPRILRKKWKSP